MTDEAALLRTICADPAADTPRLVYADWLDENGQPERAAFIRTEVDVYRRPEWDPVRIRHEQAGRWPDWRALPPLPARGLEWSGTPVVRRGFVWCLRVTDPNGLFRGRWAEIDGRAPVERMEFSRYPPDLGRLAAGPWAARLTELELHGGNSGPRAVEALGHAPTLAGLRHLSFRSAAVTLTGAEALIRSPLFTKLTALTVAAHRPQVAGRFLWADVPAPPHLRTLDFGGCHLAGVLPALARRWAGQVEVLCLTNNHITADRLPAVTGTPYPELRVLNLSENPLGNAGGAAVAAAVTLPNLLVLDLSRCQVGDDGMRAVLDSPLADRLVFLDLFGSPASAEVKAELKARMGDRVRV